MSSVFVLRHIHSRTNDEDVKFIGVYRFCDGSVNHLLLANGTGGNGAIPNAAAKSARTTWSPRMNAIVMPSPLRTSRCTSGPAS